jgi:hypothetical protein
MQPNRDAVPGSGVTRRTVVQGLAVSAGAMWIAPSVHTVRGLQSSGSVPPEETTTTTTTTTVPLTRGVHLRSACTDTEPYAVDIVLVGFAPSRDFRYRIHVNYLSSNTTFDDAFWFTTDAGLTTTFPNAIPHATEPFEIAQLTLFHDPDHDDTADGCGTCGPDDIVSFRRLLQRLDPLRRCPPDTTIDAPRCWSRLIAYYGRGPGARGGLPWSWETWRRTW